MNDIIHHKDSLTMYHIYALKCEELVLYVGQTTDMYNRFTQHLNKSHPKCGSSDIPDNIEYYMEVLQNVNTKEEAKQKEQYFYDTLKPLYNKYRPGTPFKQILAYMGKNKMKK